MAQYLCLRLNLPALDVTEILCIDVQSGGAVHAGFSHGPGGLI